MLNWFFVKFAL